MLKKKQFFLNANRFVFHFRLVAFRKLSEFKLDNQRCTAQSTGQMVFLKTGEKTKKRFFYVMPAASCTCSCTLDSRCWICDRHPPHNRIIRKRSTNQRAGTESQAQLHTTQTFFNISHSEKVSPRSLEIMCDHCFAPKT